MGLTPQRWRRASERLDDLLELEPAERERQLIALAADEPELAADLRRLLRADAATGPLDTGMDRLSPTLLEDLAGDADEHAADLSGQTVGAFRLVRLLGRGGMGEVYLAERASGDARQTVALKLLRPGADRGDIAR